MYIPPSEKQRKLYVIRTTIEQEGIFFDNIKEVELVFDLFIEVRHPEWKGYWPDLNNNIMEQFYWWLLYNQKGITDAKLQY